MEKIMGRAVECVSVMCGIGVVYGDIGRIFRRPKGAKRHKIV